MIPNSSQKNQRNKATDHLKRHSSKYREMSPRSLSKRKITKSNSGKMSRFSISKMTSSFMKKIKESTFNFLGSKSIEKSPGTESVYIDSNFSTPDFKSKRKQNSLDSNNEGEYKETISKEEKKIKNLIEEVKLISDSKKNLAKIFQNQNNSLIHRLNIEHGKRLEEISRKSVVVSRSRNKLKKYQDEKDEEERKRIPVTMLLRTKRMRMKLKNRGKLKKEIEKLQKKVEEVTEIQRRFKTEIPSFYSSQ